MNDGLVVLAGWLQLGLLVAVLVALVLRQVAGQHERRSARFHRPEPPPSDARRRP